MTTGAKYLLIIPEDFMGRRLHTIKGPYPTLPLARAAKDDYKKWLVSHTTLTIAKIVEEEHL